MITPPAGWQHTRTDLGLILWQGRTVIRYAERMRPLRRISELVKSLGRPEGFVHTSTTEIERATTHEGEQAAMLTLTGKIGEDVVELGYGFVLLDDSYACLTSIAYTDYAAVRELLRSLLVSDVQLLGHARRRRFVYEPPIGWQGAGGPHDARWYPNDYPANPSRIFVNPALPSSPDIERQILAKMVGGMAQLEAAQVVPVAPLFTRSLVGRHYHLRLAGRRADSHLFFLHDDSHLYSVRADGDPTPGLALVASIEPVPRPWQPVNAGDVLNWLAD